MGGGRAGAGVGAQQAGAQEVGDAHLLRRRQEMVSENQSPYMYMQQLHSLNSYVLYGIW